MKNLVETFILIGIIIGTIICTSYFMVTYNDLVSLNEDVKFQQSQIETTLQRRSDLIPNLVATVKGYADHEEEVFTEIANARSKVTNSIESGNIKNISEANENLNSAIERLLVISENYPELKASEHFTALQDELAGTENRIAVARQYYNEKVKIYNTKILTFPTNIVAQIFGYYPIQYFESTSNANEVPEVDFN